MTKTDVTILGGGLAGLTLARQINARCPELSVTVIERASHPVPLAAHKVGESTVEIGAEYLATTLGLRDHLDSNHLKKFGLRCFFGDARNIDQADELGASESLPVSSYQIDRGMLENFLGVSNREAGVEFVDGCKVDNVDFDNNASATVEFRRDGLKQKLHSRWVIDATGRRGMFRRRYDLERTNSLKGNAVWFRVNERVRIDEWSNSKQWHNRIDSGARWLSTNHLMGKGYWVWLIPLSSGATSIGVVTDAATHPAADLSRHDRVLQWMQHHQPQCAQALSELAPMDFGGVNDYSYGCDRLFSRKPESENWALTGEAGLFLDPFYSPGTDFIAYSNSFITDIVARQTQGEDVRARRGLYQQLYQSFYSSSLSLYQNQYSGFGNFRLMSLKTVWDYAYYWAVLGFLFFNNAITKSDVFTTNAVALARIRQRHEKLQSLFTQYGRDTPVIEPSGAFTDHRKVPILYELNAALAMPIDRDNLAMQLAKNISCLNQIADEIEAMIPGGSVYRGAARPSDLLGDLGQQFAA